MKTIKKNEIESLLTMKEWPSISIYLPVSRLGDPQDAIRYKNLLTQVEDKLIQDGMRPADAHNLLAPEYDLAKDAEYWKHFGQDGLAVFLSGQIVKHYAMPAPLDELAIIGQRFNIRPLLSLHAKEKYLVLALSRNELQLFQGDRYQLREIDLPENTPKNMAEALKYDDPERQFQFHTKTSTIDGKRGAMFHGQGVGSDDQDTNLERYFQAIDRSLFPKLENMALPIVLAGTEELHAVYRGVTKSQAILPGGISGNVEDLAEEIIHQKAWDIAKEYFLEQEHEIIRTFKDHLGSGRVIDDLELVLTAALDGRIETLFVAENEQVWGAFDAKSRKVTVKEQVEGTDINLLDEAVYLTSTTKGTVYVKKLHAMPTDTCVSAQLRY